MWSLGGRKEAKTGDWGEESETSSVEGKRQRWGSGGKRVNDWEVGKKKRQRPCGSGGEGL